MKRYMKMALLYAVLAMIGGVFYREFTKFNGFTGKTALGVVHTHYFLLGTVFFLLLLLLEKSFSFTGTMTGRILVIYHIGLNLTSVMFVIRGGVPGSGDIPVLRYECGGFRHCRDRSHFAGCQLDSCPDTNQTQSFVKKYLIFLSILCILIAVQLM